jgi:hypothetical protein
LTPGLDYDVSLPHTPDLAATMLAVRMKAQDLVALTRPRPACGLIRAMKAWGSASPFPQTAPPHHGNLAGPCVAPFSSLATIAPPSPAAISTDPLSLREQIQRYANDLSKTPDDLSSFLYQIARQYEGPTKEPGFSLGDITRVRDNMLLLLDTRSGDSILERMSLDALYKMAFFTRETSCALERLHQHHPMESLQVSSGDTPFQLKRSLETNIPLQALQLSAANIGHKIAQLMRIRANSLKAPEDIFAWFEGAAMLLGIHDALSSSWRALSANQRTQIGGKRSFGEQQDLTIRLGETVADSDTLEELQPAVTKLMAALQLHYQSVWGFGGRGTNESSLPSRLHHHDHPVPQSSAVQLPSLQHSISRGYSQLHSYLAVFQVVSLNQPHAPREAANRLFCIANHPFLASRFHPTSSLSESPAELAAAAKEKVFLLTDLLQHVKAITKHSDHVANTAADATRAIITAIDRAMLRCINEGKALEAFVDGSPADDRTKVMLTLELLSLHTQIRPSGFVCPILFVPLVEAVTRIAEKTSSALTTAKTPAVTNNELLEVQWRLFKLRTSEPRLMAVLLHNILTMVRENTAKKKAASQLAGRAEEEGTLKDETVELSIVLGKVLRMLHGLGISRDLLKALGARNSKGSVASSTSADDDSALVALGTESMATFLRELASWQEAVFAAELPRVYRRTPFAYPHRPAVWQKEQKEGVGSSDKREVGGQSKKAGAKDDSPTTTTSSSIIQRYRVPLNKAKAFDKKPMPSGSTLMIRDVRVLPPTYMTKDAAVVVQALSSLAASLSLSSSSSSAQQVLLPVNELTERAREHLFAELSRFWKLPYDEIITAFREHVSGARTAAVINQLHSFFLWWQANKQRLMLEAASSSSTPTATTSTASSDETKTAIPEEPESAAPAVAPAPVLVTKQDDEWEVSSKVQLFPDWALRLCTHLWQTNCYTPFPTVRVNSSGGSTTFTEHEGASLTPFETESSAFQAEVFSLLKELSSDAGLPSPQSEYLIPELAIAVDIAWPKEKIVVEVEGPSHYQARSLKETAMLLSRLSGYKDKDKSTNSSSKKKKRSSKKAASYDDVGSGSSSGSDSESESGSDDKPASSKAGGAGSRRPGADYEEEVEKPVVVMVNERGGILSRSTELIPTAILREAALKACGYTVIRVSCHDLYILIATEAVQAGLQVPIGDAGSSSSNDGSSGDDSSSPIHLPRAPAGRPGQFWTRDNPKAFLRKLLGDAGVWDKLRASSKASAAAFAASLRAAGKKARKE